MRMRTAYTASLIGLLEKLAAIGAEKNGGVSRLLYTQAWDQAQNYLAEQMREKGLEARFDRVGNLYGRLQGHSETSGVILTGSHVDTVRSGGKYDGAYGIAAALIAVQFLKETYGKPKKTIEVASFCEEEGSRFPLAYWGSGNVSGFFSIGQADSVSDSQGITMKEAMVALGFGKDEQASPLREDIIAFIELHIEQGMILGSTGSSVGIVELIYEHLCGECADC